MQRSIIFIIGTLYTLILFFLVGGGFQVFGVCATIGGLLLHILWKKSHLEIFAFLKKYALLVSVILLGAVSIPIFFFMQHGVEAAIAVAFIIPAYVTLGLSWFIFCDIILKKLWGKVR